MAKEKFDPINLNGVHKLKGKDGNIGFVRLQWYPGIERYYAIIDDDASSQFSWSITKTLKFLKVNKIEDDATT